MIAEIIQGLGGILIALINVYIWVVIIAALISFVNPDPYNPIVQFLYRITNPAYALVRKFMRTNFNGIDLAPLVIIIALQVVIVILSSLLRHL
ncbi:YggT family protein [Sulfurimonas sp. C5]|uniref:YggT family protein n=1 Tax=Sulfurimonas sp. C5 TaxID=3036947 RepID=UPI002458B565|nr:YggT family protein [Sulfurimonas sp. C5]MDH4943923.1 YggT family protein [Sulfurimonas sp. C5]